MAQLIAAGQLVEVRWYCSLGNQVSQTVRHYFVSATTAPSVTDAQFVGPLSTTFSTLFRNAMAAAATYLGCRLQIIKPARFLDQISTAGTGAGGATGDPLPPMTAGRIRLYTGVASRRTRGRVYVPFPAEGSNDSPGDPNAGYIATVTTLATNLIGDQTVTIGGGSATLSPVVFSRIGNSTQGVTTFQVSPVWGSNRHRSRQKGGDRPWP